MDSDLASVYSKAPHYEVQHLFANLTVLNAFKKSGRKVGKLRFKGDQHFKTFNYNQFGFKLLPKNDKFGLSSTSRRSVIFLSGYIALSRVTSSR
jgi:putative transposase